MTSEKPKCFEQKLLSVRDWLCPCSNTEHYASNNRFVSTLIFVKILKGRTPGGLFNIGYVKRYVNEHGVQL